MLFSRCREHRDGAGEGARRRSCRQWAAGTARSVRAPQSLNPNPRTPRSPFPASPRCTGAWLGLAGGICRWEFGVPRGEVSRLPGLCWGQGKGRRWGCWPGAASGAACAGRTPELSLGLADRAGDSARCWGDGTESCETAHGNGVNEPRVKDCHSPFIQKSHGAIFKLSGFSPPGGGIWTGAQLVPHCPGFGVCACTACKATRE